MRSERSYGSDERVVSPSRRQPVKLRILIVAVLAVAVFSTHARAAQQDVGSMTYAQLNKAAKNEVARGGI